MAKIENYKYSIEEAFRDCFYIVPDYQREYVWTEKEVLQLLDDINEQIDDASTREYFVGTILVSPSTPKNHFEVIDGQQRLTTFFLLLCVLRHLFRNERQGAAINGLISTNYTAPDGESKESLKLEPRYENAGEVMTTLVQLNADPEATRIGIQLLGISSFGSLENLVNAYATIFRYLNDTYDDVTKLKKYWGYLANNVVFIQISTDISSALKIFETINERGVGLNSMDLLKNLLFTHVSPSDFTRLKDEWKKVTKPLEKAKEKPLRFLRYFLMANYVITNDRGDAVVREDEIYDWLTNNTNARTCDYAEQPFPFVRKIIGNVELYLGFASGRGNDGTANVPMDNLKKLTGGAFSLHFVLLLAAAKLPKSLFDYFVTQLESFLFYYIFTKTATKELERNFSIWADELRAISVNGNAAAQRAKLQAFLVEHFKESMDNKKPELRDTLRRLSQDSMQQYRIRYLLAKLTQYVDLAYKGLREPGPLGEYTVLEIEHILPQSPKQELREEFDRQNPGADYDTNKKRLGNLALLEKPINIIAGNDFFALKRPEYAKCKYYLTSSLQGLVEVGRNSSITRINKKLRAFDEWNVSAIDSRQAMLVDLAFEVWRIADAPP